MLHKHGAALCLHDLLEDHPVELTADWTYLRFHGPNARQNAYVGSYDHRRLGRAAEQISTWATQGLDVYAYFNNDYGGAAVSDATWLIGHLGTRATATGSAIAKVPSATLSRAKATSRPRSLVSGSGRRGIVSASARLSTRRGRL